LPVGARFRNGTRTLGCALPAELGAHNAAAPNMARDLNGNLWQGSRAKKLRGTATVHLFGATVVLFGLGAWAQDALVTQ